MNRLVSGCDKLLYHHVPADLPSVCRHVHSEKKLTHVKKLALENSQRFSRHRRWFSREMKRGIERGTDRFKTYLTEKGNRGIDLFTDTAAILN